MDTWLKFLLLVIAGYLLGSIPLSYLSGRARGIDIKKRGTHQVGAGNLWRTTSRTLGLFVGIYDFGKGMLMVFIAQKVGLDASMQLLTGIAVIIGHNWPLFLRFHGGRGIATALGLVIIMPSLNAGIVTTWPLIIFFAVGIAVLIVAHRTPVPVLVAVISLPITCAIVNEPLQMTLGYTVLLVVIIVKRLTAQPNTDAVRADMGHVLLNRLLFDRDIKDRRAWVQRKDIQSREFPK